MTNYRERWQTQHSVHFVPNALRGICDESLDEIFSTSPMRPSEAQLIAAHQALMKAQSNSK